MTEALARYNDIQQAEASEIEDALREQVEQMGTVAEYG
jgi:hypothetical protein